MRIKLTNNADISKIKGNITNSGKRRGGAGIWPQKKRFI